MLLRDQAPPLLGLLHHILESNADATAVGVFIVADVDAGLVGERETRKKLLLNVS